MSNEQNITENDKNEDDGFVVPGRISLEDLHKQSQELKAAKEAMSGKGRGSERMFKAVSMYSVAIDFALILALPLVAFIFIGRWADNRFGTRYLVVVGILLAIATSSMAVARQIKKISNFIKKKP